jgi:hypothetical protein
MIKTWQERCEEHPDHEGIVTEQMIRDRMQEEIDALRQAIEQAEKQEPVAWFTDDHREDKSATTYSKRMAERWKEKGWPVTPLYTSPVHASDISQERVDETGKERHEPVAWMMINPSHLSGSRSLHWEPQQWHITWEAVPLYVAPPKREWVGLTDEAVWLEYQQLWPFHPEEEPTLAKDIAKFARAIEAKLKEKNT